MDDYSDREKSVPIFRTPAVPQKPTSSVAGKPSDVPMVKLPVKSFPKSSSTSMPNHPPSHTAAPPLQVKSILRNPSKSSEVHASKYHDHRLGPGLKGSSKFHPQHPEQYQDHRLGNALHTEMPASAGDGKRYQDHRLGSGIGSNLLQDED